jgi:hypothetical protein
METTQRTLKLQLAGLCLEFGRGSQYYMKALILVNIISILFWVRSLLMDANILPVLFTNCIIGYLMLGAPLLVCAVMLYSSAMELSGIVGDLEDARHYYELADSNMGSVIVPHLRTFNSLLCPLSD